MREIHFTIQGDASHALRGLRAARVHVRDLTRTFTMADYRLARTFGWRSWHPERETQGQGEVRSALQTARALYAYRRDPTAQVEWERIPDSEWDGDFPMTGELYDTVLYVEGEIVGSLGRVNVLSLDDPYCRIVEAELYEEKPLSGEAERVERCNAACRDIITI